MEEHTIEFRGWSYEKGKTNSYEHYEEGEWNASKEYTFYGEFSYELLEKYAIRCAAELFPNSYLGIIYGTPDEKHDDDLTIFNEYIVYTISADSNNCFTANYKAPYWYTFNTKVYLDGKELDQMVSMW